MTYIGRNDIRQRRQIQARHNAVALARPFRQDEPLGTFTSDDGSQPRKDQQR